MPTPNSRRPTRITEKQARYARIGEIKAAAIAALAGGEPPKFDAAQDRRRDRPARVQHRAAAASSLASRASTVATCDTVRPIRVETGVLPRTHGSALFTRGETQALVTTTLGTGRDAQIIDALAGERKEPFMLHYNFPPFSVGETGMMGSPKRREIGHGNLARRGVERRDAGHGRRSRTCMRVVSEILESNGSSSMASVCGTSLSLMDAGVPIKAPVAGIAMGLVLEGGRFQVLTDILGDEDHLGDMDFKVAGTADGVTALQMDIKIEGITREIMQVALDAGPQGAGCTSSARWTRCIDDAAREDVRVGADDHHDQDRPGEDPRSHRQGRCGHPRHHRGDRHARSTSRTTAPSRSRRSTARRAARRSVASS